MKYIYESPDKGKTIYRTPIGVPHAERELIRENDVVIKDDESFTVLVDRESGIVIESATIDDLLSSYDDDVGELGLDPKGRQS